MDLLVFADRDGTINKDENYYLGSSPNWKNQVTFLDGVVEGIRLINSIPNSKFYIITNQSGVPLTGGDFDNIDEKRVDEVNNYIVSKLKDLNAIVDGCYVCPYVDNRYAKVGMEKGRTFNFNYVVDNHPDMKPSPGMIIKAINRTYNSGSGSYKGFMIGDRETDVDAGLNAGITGILVNKDRDKYKQKYEAYLASGKVLIVDNFLDAAKHIAKAYK
ncbi:MAG TPA: HAD hydrolase-like protein [Alphaproteobacteria bacterium]|nr:HAD hydrolase-like protein [Alphaproteobacteria bacterium]